VARALSGLPRFLSDPHTPSLCESPVAWAAFAPTDATSACRRCQRPAPDLDSPPALYWELIAEGGEVVGVICPDCLTLREQRAIRAEKARVLRRLKRGLPLERGHG